MRQFLGALDTFVRANPLTVRLMAILALALAYVTGLWHPAAGAILVAGPILLDDVNTVTTKTIMPGVVDNFFRAGPLIAYLKTRFTRRWIGPQIQENYMY